MVGAPSTNRCGACKARKCDEEWPVCGPCKRGRRTCPGPPVVPTRFVAYSQPGRERERLIRDNYESPQQLSRRLSESHSDENFETNNQLLMIPLKTVKKEGGTFQKIRLCGSGNRNSLVRQIPRTGFEAPQSPGLTRGEALSLRFNNLLQWDSTIPSPHLHLHGLWHRDLLQRLGASDALDNTMLLMLDSNDSIARGEDPSTWFNLSQYGKALRSLQNAIDNPKTRFSIDTLAAIALIYRTICGLAATHGGIHKQAVHAEALSTILKVRGIQNRQDPLEFLLATECQIAAVQHCISTRVPEPCVFDTEEWGAALEVEYDEPMIVTISRKMYRETIKWPGMLNALLSLPQVPSNTGKLYDLLEKAFTIAGNLERISHTFENVLQDPKVCSVRTSMDPLVPIVYDFKETTVPPLLGFFCLYSNFINQIIIDMSALLTTRLKSTPTPKPSPDSSTKLPIPRYDALSTFFSSSTPITVPLSKASIAMIEARIAQLCQKIWMMCEQARTWKPVGGLFILNPLRGTFVYASPKMRKWIFDVAVDVEGYVQGQKQWDIKSMSPQWGSWIVY